MDRARSTGLQRERVPVWHRRGCPNRDGERRTKHAELCIFTLPPEPCDVLEPSAAGPTSQQGLLHEPSRCEDATRFSGSVLLAQRTDNGSVACAAAFGRALDLAVPGGIGRGAAAFEVLLFL